ncbi:MAG: hypothetical protein HPY57_14975 [Ignavibacteria bacterium]|nr:hypothetical protein [Ignavibacteria bacterium]
MEEVNKDTEFDNTDKKLHISDVSCRFLSRETLRKIIELSAYEDSKGDVWGMDTYLGKMDELIDDAIKIIKENDN